jgi:16S rRNA (cytosine967-C5)-methyltransferase
MTPAARLAAAIEVLESYEREDAPADRLLAAWGRANRYAGSKDRAAIADRVYTVLRRWRSLAWPLRAETARAAVIGSVLAEGGDPAALFDGQRYGPAPLTDAERAALASPPPPPPDPVRLDYPDWLDGRLRDSLGDRFETVMAALRERAPADLRVNALRTDREAARAALAAEGVETDPVALSPLALRAAPGAPIARTGAYADGLVEPQDAASQAVAEFAAARPGETTLDVCAGGGGKTLALAAAQRNEGLIAAWDADLRRMRDLPARAARAGAAIRLLDAAGLEALRGRCDLVLVDAPCSGSGSWRRDPGGKWRLTAARLADLVALQARLLTEAASFAAPGGRIVFATCSLLSEETAPPAPQGWREAARLTLTPAEGGDGFGAARFERLAGG